MLRKFLVILGIGGIIFLLILGPQWVSSFLLNLGVIDGVEGYIVAGAIALVTNAFIFLPVYNVTPVIVEIADHNTLWLVAGVYALASAFGETTGYFAGKTAKKIPGFEESRLYGFFKKLMGGSRTGLKLFLLAISPFPFDVGGIVAGSIKFPLKWFIALTFAGRWIKYLFLLWGWGGIEKLISQIPFIGNSAETVMLFFFLLLIVIFMWAKLITFLKHRWNGTSDKST